MNIVAFDSYRRGICTWFYDWNWKEINQITRNIREKLQIKLVHMNKKKGCCQMASRSEYLRMLPVLSQFTKTIFISRYHMQ